MEEIRKEQSKNARHLDVTDRPAQIGDTAVISYLGTVDGVPFDGGQSDSYSLELGSHSFIEGFEEQVVGHSVGEKFDINVTFPEEYHAPDLAGKPAVFSIEIKEIHGVELPELNDEFVQDISECNTVDEYKKTIMDKLMAEKEVNAKNAKQDELIKKVVENAQMDIPKAMIEARADQLVEQFANQLKASGIPLNTYLQYLGTTREQLKEQYMSTAEKNVQSGLVLEAIVKAENLTMPKEELDEEIKKVGANFNIKEDEIFDIFKGEERDNFEKDLLIQKAIKLIEDTAVEVAPAK